MASIRSKLVTGAAVVAAAAGGATIASAATSGKTSSSSASSTPTSQRRDPSRAVHTVNGRIETLLSGAVESKVRAAALAKVPGTVERVETNVDSGAPYEAHIRKSDGTEVEVQVGSDYAVSAVNAMGGHR